MSRGAAQDAISRPASGLRVTADFTNPAMGLRVMGLRLVNCGDAPRRIEGCPGVTLLDEDAEALDVEVVNGSGGIAFVEGFDDPPVLFDLEPGEQASAGLMWRNTVTHVDDFRYPAPYLTVSPMPGEDAQLVIPDGGIDTGSTGIAGVSSWKPFPGPLINRRGHGGGSRGDRRAAVLGSVAGSGQQARLHEVSAKGRIVVVDVRQRLVDLAFGVSPSGVEEGPRQVFEDLCAAGGATRDGLQPSVGEHGRDVTRPAGFVVCPGIVHGPESSRPSMPGQTVFPRKPCSSSARTDHDHTVE